MTLRTMPTSVQKANEIVKVWHRHHRPTLGGLFAIAATVDGLVVGVCIVGRPLARTLPPSVCEVVRVATDGTRNACSFLLGAAAKVARTMGYRRIITYVLPEEGGASLRGAGWKLEAVTAGGSWSRVSRKRDDNHPLGAKNRWARTFPGGVCPSEARWPEESKNHPDLFEEET